MEGGGDNTQYDHLSRGSGSGSKVQGRSKADIERLRVAAQYRQLRAELTDAPGPAAELREMHASSSIPEPGSHKAPNTSAGNAAGSQSAPHMAAARTAASAAKGARPDEARMLRDMFQAIWPDMSGAKSWTSATKVASMTGSLSLSLAFFGVVYYFSTKYERSSNPEPRQADTKGK